MVESLRHYLKAWDRIGAFQMTFTLTTDQADELRTYLDRPTPAASVPSERSAHHNGIIAAMCQRLCLNASEATAQDFWDWDALREKRIKESESTFLKSSRMVFDLTEESCRLQRERDRLQARVAELEADANAEPTRGVVALKYERRAIGGSIPKSTDAEDTRHAVMGETPSPPGQKPA